MPPKKLIVSGPVQKIPTTPPVKPLVPDLPDLLVKLKQTAKIRRASVILVMAPEFPVERFLLRVHRVMPMLAAPRGHGFQTASQPFAHRADMNREIPFPASLTDMRESKKIESRRLRPTGLF